jgi:hypothetical protein
MARIEQHAYDGPTCAGSDTGPADGPVVIRPHGRRKTGCPEIAWPPRSAREQAPARWRATAYP